MMTEETGPLDRDDLREVIQEVLRTEVSNLVDKDRPPPKPEVPWYLESRFMTIVGLVTAVLLTLFGITISVLWSQRDLIDSKTSALEDKIEESERRLTSEAQTSSRETGNLIKDSKDSLRANQEGGLQNLESKLGSSIESVAHKFEDLRSRSEDSRQQLAQQLSSLQAGQERLTNKLDTQLSLMARHVDRNFDLVAEIEAATIDGEIDQAKALLQRLTSRDRLLPLATTKASNYTISLLLEGVEIDFLTFLKHHKGIDLVNAADPDWSPNRQEMVFVSRGERGKETSDPTHDIFVYKFTTDTLSRITRSAYDYRFPRWSPNGSSLLFSRERREAVPGAETENWSYDLYVGSWSSSAKKSEEFHEARLTSGADGVNNVYGTWSPDGRWVLFTSDQTDGSYSLRYKKVEGDSPSQPVPSPPGNYSCQSDWYGESPSRIVYTIDDRLFVRDVLLEGDDLVFEEATSLHEGGFTSCRNCLDSESVDYFCPSFYDKDTLLYSVAGNGWSEVWFYRFDHNGNEAKNDSGLLLSSRDHKFLFPRPIRVSLQESELSLGTTPAHVTGL